MQVLRTLTLAASATALTACGGVSSPQASDGRESAAPPSALATAAALPAPRAPVTNSPESAPMAAAGSAATPSAAAAAPGCWGAQGGGAGSARMRGITSAAGSGHDRFVVEFDSAVPEYQLALNPAGTRFSVYGQTVSLAGGVGGLLRLSRVSTPAELLLNGDTHLQSATLQEVRLFVGGADTATFAFGLGSSSCPQVSVLAFPPRLVIDFPG
jgi:hypothetical protein